MILGLIPARGGSVRIPRKNLRLLGGRPLFIWSILQAQGAEWIDRIAVSSDDDEVLDLAAGHGVMLIRRPKLMAADAAPMYPAILHALEVAGRAYAYLCLLHPTSPLRTSDDIDACCALCVDMDLPAVVSAETGAAVPNGAVYVGRSGWLQAGGDFDDPALLKYEMPPERSVDVNTPEDFERAERLMAMRQVAAAAGMT